MTQYNPPRRSQDGFSLATVMLITLAVILGSIAMIDRATSGWLGSLFVGQSREARDAAEIGMMRVVSQLNRSRNRRLLVNASLLNGQTPQQIEADTRLISRCTTLTPDLGGSASNSPLGELGTASITGTPRDIDTSPRAGSGTIRSYEIIDITQPSTSRELNTDGTANSDFAIRPGHDSSPGQAGEITVRVRGQVRRGSTILSSTTLTETLDVTPKCCGRSFNGLNNVFGNDSRACDWPPSAVIAGTGKDTDDPGGLSASGASVSFNAENEGDPLSYVMCITTGCQSASNLNTNTGTSIKEEGSINIKDEAFTPEFTSLSGTPLFGASTIDCAATTSSACNVSLSSLTYDDGVTTYPLNGGVLTLDTSATSRPSWPRQFKQLCAVAQENLPDGTQADAIHCNFNTLDFGANNRTIQLITQGGPPIRLYFPNMQSGTAKTINQRNNGTFRHADGEVTDLIMLGSFNNPCNGDQTVDLGNGSSEALRLFAYFRCGTVNIGGNGGYEGVLWTNNIVANGNVTFNVPTNAVSDVLSLIGWETTMVDWVARAIRSITLF